MWRPKGWKKCTVDNLTNYEGITHAECYEAGADAILEALIKDTCKLEKQKGWWAFIPDEQE